jgi:hypothetical protein
MSCGEWESRIRPWLKGLAELEEAPEMPPEDIAAHVRGCESCARRLWAALLLLRGAELRREPDPGLASRVSERLAREPRRVSAPQWKGLRVALAAAAVLLVALTAGLLTWRSLRAESSLVVVHLMLEAPQARTVSVVGDWNAWDPSRDRLRDPKGDGTWVITLRLRKGEELRYQFLIDGERWVPDPRAPLQVDDGFGGTSSVLQI